MRLETYQDQLEKVMGTYSKQTMRITQDISHGLISMVGTGDAPKTVGTVIEPGTDGTCELEKKLNQVAEKYVGEMLKDNQDPLLASILKSAFGLVFSSTRDSLKNDSNAYFDASIVAQIMQKTKQTISEQILNYCTSSLGELSTTDTAELKKGLAYTLERFKMSDNFPTLVDDVNNYEMLRSNRDFQNGLYRAINDVVELESRDNSGQIRKRAQKRAESSIIDLNTDQSHIEQLARRNGTLGR
jgi:hypothetical protein